VTDLLPHTLRSDARDNRDRILDAARAVFATAGLNVSMREIARRAGVGPATLYRRFPAKELLVTEAFAHEMRACHMIVDEGLADPDPWHGFCLVIEKICDQHARNHGFTMAFMSAYPHAIDFATDRAYALDALAELARRAKDTGRLRPDFVLDPDVYGSPGHPRHLARYPARRLPALRHPGHPGLSGFSAADLIGRRQDQRVLAGGQPPVPVPADQDVQGHLGERPDDGPPRPCCFSRTWIWCSGS
jgi:AcrR family transcriptional regulator